MKSLLASVVVPALLAGSLAGVTAAQSASVGDKPAFKFTRELANGQGVTSLEDLRGRPVLVDFWGTRCPPCIGFAVPSALKMAEQYGEDLAVVLVEVQGASPEQMGSFALNKKWFGTGAMWTTERPFSLGLDGIPQSALISPEGEIVLLGYTQEIHSELEKKVEELVERSKGAPDWAPKSLKKAWQTFGKGQYGKALAEARKAVEAGGADAEAAQRTVDAFEDRVGKRIARAQWQLDNGYPAQAKGALEGLAKELKGETELAERVTAQLARLDDDAMKRELEADLQLAKLESKLYEDPGDERYAKLLRRLAEEHQGTRVCERANRLAAAIGG